MGQQLLPFGREEVAKPTEEELIAMVSIARTLRLMGRDPRRDCRPGTLGLLVGNYVNNEPLRMRDVLIIHDEIDPVESPWGDLDPLECLDEYLRHREAEAEEVPKNQ